VLYEMLTGEAPFGGETNGDVIVSVLEREPLPLTDHLAEAPAELQRIVAKSLCKERAGRYQNVKDVLLDLKSLREELEFAARLEDSAGTRRGVAAAPRRSDVQVVDTEREPVARTRTVPSARASARDVRSSGWIRRHWRGAALTLAGLGLVLAALLAFELRPPPPPKIVGYTQLTNDGRPKRYDWPIATDGARLYFGEWLGVDPGVTISQVSVAGGETAPILLSRPGSSLAFPRLRDISPDKSELLFVSKVGFTDTEQELWVLPVLSGSPRRVGDVRAHEAAWSPDGQRIVYANGNDLYLVRSDGADSRKLLTVPGGQAWFIHWSPDGSRLRFTLLNDSGISSLWEVSADGSNPHQILPGWNNPASECCGMWTPDGRYYVFISYQAPSLSTANGNVWAVREQGGFFRGSNSEPVQLTSGPLSFTQLVPSLDGKRLFARGELRRGELVRYDATAGQFVTYLSGIPAQWADFSRDGAWVTYVAYPEDTLWRSRADGSERLQLSFPPMRAALPRWSPDGRRIAFMGKLPGKTEQIYLVSAEGGIPEVLTPSEYNQGDPVWSPDGNRLVFGLSLNDKTAGIHMIDLRTKQVSMILGSEALFAPRWSPDGRYLVALSADSDNLMLYDLTAGKWEKLAEGMFGYPNWSRDGKYVYYEYYNAITGVPAIFRLRLSDRKIEPVVDLKNFARVYGAYGEWSGLAPDDSVIALHAVGSQELYALDWQAP
jgi:Tol biopolymer transport system component